jgi:hypothetical protein
MSRRLFAWLMTVEYAAFYQWMFVAVAVALKAAGLGSGYLFWFALLAFTYRRDVRAVVATPWRTPA